MAQHPSNKKLEHWFRLGSFLHEPLTEALRDVLHNTDKDPSYQGLPSDPKDLYNRLDQNHRSTLDKLLRKGVLQNDQYNLIFPHGRNETDSSKFDVTLLVILIRNCTNLPPPIHGWDDKNTPLNDQSKAANCLRARNWRNFFHHVDPESIDKQECQRKWYEGEVIANRLGYTKDTKHLLTVCLDGTRFSQVQSMMVLLNGRQDQLQKKVDQNNNHFVNMISLSPEIKQLQEDTKELRQFVTKNIKLAENIEQIKPNIEVAFQSMKLIQEGLENTEECMLQYDGKGLEREVPAPQVDADLNQFVLPEVIKKTSELIDNKWGVLATCLGISQIIVEKIDNEFQLRQEKMLAAFAELRNKVSWKRLKAELRNINRMDIVEALRNETLLTSGIRDASRDLRSMYVKELMTWMIAQPFMGHDGIVYKSQPRQDAFVELAIVDASEIDKDWCIPDREYHMKANHFKRRSIPLEKILTNTDTNNFVIVRGVAGIGKSTMIDSYVLKWANKEILNGDLDSPKIDFLFKLTCRQLNTLENINSAEIILQKTYPSIFRKISLEDLTDISDRVLILLDGTDELQDIHSLESYEERTHLPPLNSVHTLMSNQWMMLPDHKTIVAGRPEACRIVKSTYGEYSEIKLVEICGFNQSSVYNYIEHYFQDRNDIADTIKMKINESENLKVMSTIPIYTWVICALFDEDITIKSPQTTTELFSYACLLFIRNHLKAIKDASDFKNKTLDDLTQDHRVLDMINCLAKLSMSTLEERKVMFPEAYISQYCAVIDIEKSGFLCKHQYGEHKAYQFRHLVLQEFLTGLRLHLKPHKDNLTKSCFSSCLPVVAGLHGIEISPSPSITKTFLHNMQAFLHSRRRLSFSLLSPRHSSYVMEFIEKLLLDHASKDDFVINDVCMNALAAVYEYQGDLPHSFSKKIARKQISIENIIFHHEIKNIIHFLGKINAHQISSISVHNLDDKIFPDNFYLLLKLFIDNGGESENDGIKFLHLRKDTVMRLYSEEDKMDSITSKILNFSLPNVESFEKHQKLLALISQIVDEVHISFSLDDLYPSFKKLMVDNICTSEIKFYDLPSSCQENAFPVSYNQVQMMFDAKTEFINTSLLVEKEGATVIYASSVVIENEQKRSFSLGLSSKNLTKYDKDVITNLFALFDEIQIDYSLVEIYQVLKEILEHKKYAEKISIVGIPDLKFKVNVSWNQMVMILDAHLKFANENVLYQKLFHFSEGARTYMSLDGSDLGIEISHSRNGTAHVKKISLYFASFNESEVQQCIDTVFPFVEKIEVAVRDSTSFVTLLLNAMKLCYDLDRGELKSLSLPDCNISKEHIQILQTFVKYLKKLDLSLNEDLTPQSIISLSNALATASENEECNLKVLKLCGCNLTDEHVKNLQSCLQYIHKLDLSWNKKLSPVSMKFISDHVTDTALRTQCNLKVLKLQGSFLTEKHFCNLQPCLKYIQKLETDVTIGQKKRHRTSRKICAPIGSPSSHTIKHSGRQKKKKNT